MDPFAGSDDIESMPPSMNRRQKHGQGSLHNDDSLWFTLVSLIRSWIPPISLSLIIFLLLGIAQLTIGLVAWDLVSTSSRKTMLTFSREHHRETVAKAVKALQVRINTAERLVRIQRAGWESGALGDATPAMRQRTFRDLLDMLVAYRESVAAIYYTSRTMGLNGYYVERTAAGEYAYQVWDTDASGTFFNSAIDPESGANVGEPSITLGYNASDEMWVTTVMPPRKYAPPMWTKPYGWGSTLWLTLSNPVFDADGQLAAIAGADFDLGFITNILQKIIDEQQAAAGGAAVVAANVTTYLFDATGDAILGSSIPENIITRLEFDGAYRTLSMAELGHSVDPRLDLVANYIRTQNSRLGARARWSFSVPGYFVETAIVNSTYAGSNLRWILVQLVAENSVTDVLDSAAATTRAALGVAVAVSFLVAIGVSRALLVGLRSVYLAVVDLAQLDFGKAVGQVEADREREEHGVGVREVWEVQRAAARLVMSFAAFAGAARGDGEGSDDEEMSEKVLGKRKLGLEAVGG